MDSTKYPILTALESPEALHAMPAEQLAGLAEECRAFLIESIGRTGGHLGAALGVVELTIALFHHFNFSQDAIVWDVGHQAHTHKLLTGRAGRFPQYGQWGGLSKFLDREESPYDHIGAGHASTSISAALGLALARDLTHGFPQNLNQHLTPSSPESLTSAALSATAMPSAPAPNTPHRHVMAVIGDGAMTGGLAYEALNMAGHLDLNLLVVLNDNGMSIDQNVGAISRTVSRITSSDSYNALRREVKRVSGRVPFGRRILQWLKLMERSVKDYASPQAAFFESLGFNYIGPVNGHDLHELLRVTGLVKQLRGPVLLHVLTVKGKGLGPQVENSLAAHAVPETAPPPDHPNHPGEPGVQVPMKSWTRVFSEGMAQLMAQDPTVVALTAAMCSSTGLAPLRERYPRRVMDVGIAEANAYCSAAGMAAGGLKPFVAVYSTFTQRAFDQLIHDIALQRLPVRVMMDRGGLVGGDGPTHHGAYDLSYIRLIPGFAHMAPKDELEFRRMLLTAHGHQDGPMAIRYPRGETPAMNWTPEELTPIPLGEAEVLVNHPHPQLVLIAIGSMTAPALRAASLLRAEGILCNVVNARFVKPLDADLILAQAARAQAVMTLEENCAPGGLGEGVLALLAEAGLQRPARLLAIPDRFIPFGSHGSQLAACGLDLPSILQAARELANNAQKQGGRGSQQATG
ncbi:MAG: 1-deoxy-D-xylulose-5-phosphate synthase [Deltaproteobacteria bacterium]|nr:1-deoxy-D-xylulose-5-phosphate synthase [Deltaproteobacteria bacterium]